MTLKELLFGKEKIWNKIKVISVEFIHKKELFEYEDNHFWIQTDVEKPYLYITCDIYSEYVIYIPLNTKIKSIKNNSIIISYKDRLEFQRATDIKLSFYTTKLIKLQ